MGVNPVSVAIVLALLVLALAGMALAWRRRGRAQTGLALPQVPDDIGTPSVVASGLHVATTFAGRPLERVVVAQLGFRAPAVVTATDLGVLVDRAGAPAFFLPTAAVTGAGTASWALDKGVERDGLLVLAWSLTDAEGAAVPVESAFRFPPDVQASLLAALRPTDQEPSHADRP
ncbi:hypothetical protein [uncultured Amnibacterium sp.]|uniref:PH-like domain-containing protein n=1 Tax=uncultured Amnibacterium sp. TaxID=1631851 RepID=UPI0035CAD202